MQGYGNTHGQTEPVPPEVSVILIKSHSLYMWLPSYKLQNDEADYG